MTNYSLKRQLGFNLTERMMIYAGTLVGAVVPVFYNRYVGFGNVEGDITREAFYWTGAIITAAPLSFVGSIIGMAAGLSAGIVHKARRENKPRQPQDLERKVENFFDQ